MGKETKFGLMVGVVFIILFGVILGGRVGSAASEHAPLPVGDSMDHRVAVESILGGGDPLAPGEGTLIVGDPAAGQADLAVGEPVPEPMPQPAGIEADEVEDAEDDTVGRLVFGPVTVETPDPGALAVAPPEPLGPADTGPSGNAPAPVADESPAAPSRPVHTVCKGETLTAIAQRYYGRARGGLWRRIWDANKTCLPDPNRLDAGQELVIPGLPAQPPPPVVEVADTGRPAEAVPSVNADELARRFHVELDEGDVVRDTAPTTYTIKKGDTFYSIARRVYGDASRATDLMQANRDRVPNAKRLRVGQMIVLLEDDASATAPVRTAQTVRQVAQVAQR